MNEMGEVFLDVLGTVFKCCTHLAFALKSVLLLVIFLSIPYRLLSA